MSLSRKADLGRDIRSFISYAVGCMFGRYSLDMNGLAMQAANGIQINMFLILLIKITLSQSVMMSILRMILSAVS